MKDKEFYVKLVFVTGAILLVLFYGQKWILKPLLANSARTAAAEPAVQADVPQTVENPRNFSKEKVKISWRDAAKYVDSYVVLEGEIVSSYNNGTVCYLNFDKDYKNWLTLVIFSTKFSRFPEKPEKYYLGKKVRVEGRIKEYKGRTEIILGGRESITVL
jgi:hypothetical protein